MEEIIHIALSLYDKTGNYSRHLGATLASIFENTSSKIQIHLLHDDTLRKENKEKFEALVKKYGQYIEFHYVQLPQYVDQYNSIHRVSRGTLFRCYIDEVLQNLDKVIYLDSDIIVTLDIKHLWNSDIKLNYIGAVLDGEDYRKNMKFNTVYKCLRIDSAQYFNAGVLVMNLREIRKKYCLSEECLKFFVENPDTPALDQDALNYLFQNACTFLDSKYNLIANQYYKGQSLTNNSRDEKCIWHFAGFIKPWEICEFASSSLYWEYLHRTPWGEKVEDIIRYMSEMNNHNLPLENVLMSQRIGSRKVFIGRCMCRIFKEIKDEYFNFT